MIVDGIVNDVDHLIDVLVDVERSPLSIVVVGVGPADFRLMVRISNRLFFQLVRAFLGKILNTAHRSVTSFIQRDELLKRAKRRRSE